MHLHAGEKAPNFSVDDIYGNPVRLPDFAGKHVLLCFYRYAGCPFCNLNLKETIAFARRLNSPNLQIVAFFQSAREYVFIHPAKLAPPFPLIADPDRHVYEQYGIEESYVGGVKSLAKAIRWLKANREGFPQGAIDGDFFLMPAQFLISPSQTIELAFYWQTFGDETPFKEIERILQKRPQ